MADIGNIGQSTVQTTTQGSGSEQTVVAQQGERRGETVAQKPSPQSLAQDIQEEIGQAFQDKEGSKTAKKRQVSGRAGDLQKKVEQVQKIQDFMEKVPDARARRQDIERIARQMQGQKFNSEDDALEYLKKGLTGGDGKEPDPTLLYAALSHIESQLKESGETPELLKQLEGVSTKLLAQHGMEINKGAIVSESAALYMSELLGNAQDLRKLYMDEVVAHKGVLKSYLSIVEKYGEAGFNEALQFLLRAAGDDLSTLPSGTDRTQQKEVIDNLYQLEVLNSVRSRTDTCVKRVTALIEKEGNKVPEGFNTMSVMKELFKMVDNPYGTTEFGLTDSVKKLLPEPISVQTRINFLREFRETANMVPIKVFDSQDTKMAGELRQKILAVITEAQTTADDEEAMSLQ